MVELRQCDLLPWKDRELNLIIIILSSCSICFFVVTIIVHDISLEPRGVHIKVSLGDQPDSKKFFD